MVGIGNTQDKQDSDEPIATEAANCFVSKPCAEPDQSEELFRSMYEHVAVGVEQVAVGGRLLMVNAALCRMLGYSESELLSKTCEQITHPEDRYRETPLLEAMLRGERESYEIEKRYLHSNGSPVWVNVTSSPVRDAEGKPLYRTSVIQNISKRKQAEEALRETEQFNTAVLDTVGGLVVVLDTEGRIMRFNRACEVMTGYAAAEVQGRVFWEFLVPQQEVAGVCEVCERLRAGDFPNQHENHWVAKDGSRRLIAWTNTAIMLTDDKIAYIIGTGLDITERKQAEEALRESEEHLRSVLDNSRDVIYRLNLQTGRYEYISPSAETLVGYSPDELKALDLEASLAMIHPDDLPAMRASVARLMDTGEGELEYRQRTRDGDYRWLSNRMSLTRDIAGRPLYRNGNIRDITVHKRAEEERETTIEFLGLVNRSRGTRDLIQEATTFFQERSGCEAVGIRLREGDDYPYFEARGFSKEFLLAENKLCAEDISGKVIRDDRGNPIIECMCGNVICGRFEPSKPFFTTRGSFWSNGTTELLSRTTEADRQSSTRNRCNGEGYESVALIPLHDGKDRFGLLQLNDRRRGRFSAEVVALWERLAGYLAAALSKFRAEEALQKSERQYRAIGELINYGVWVCDPDGRNTYASESFLKLVGITQQQCSEFGWGEVLHPDDAERTIAAWKECVRTGGSWDIEHRFRGVDGQWHPILARGVPIRDDQGQITCWAGINLDISNLKHTEQALLKSEKLASVGRMAATISHEINNPLGAVTNVLFIVKGIKDLPDSARQYLEIADAELKRIAHITRQSLGFYRESNAPTLTSVTEVLESAVELLKSKIKAKRAVVEKQWDEGVKITAVAGELRQVFSNLLANSLDAIGEKGIIKLRVSSGATLKNGHCVRVTIADNGNGISATLRQQIFEPFVTTKGTTGTGLGLWVSKQIIDKHDGNIRVRSNNNGERRGTVFSVLLPVEPAAVNARSQSSGC